MILQCTNNDCNYSKEVHRARVTYDASGREKRNDFICPHCSFKMIDPETVDMDYSNVKMEKPFSDRDIKRYYDRQRKETGKKKTSSS